MITFSSLNVITVSLIWGKVVSSIGRCSCSFDGLNLQGFEMHSSLFNVVIDIKTN